MDLLAGFVVFCVVTLFTPGPNNLMLMASGLNWGWRRTLPHLTGVALGFTLMVALVGLGLGQVFALYPALYTALKYAGAAYLLWLAWGIASAGPVEEGGKASGRPMTFIEAALFQWVNPKAWIMAVGAISAYAGIAPFPWNVAIMAGLFGLLGFPSSGAWVLFGQGLASLLKGPRAVRAFNIAMGLLLAASLWPIAAELMR